MNPNLNQVVNELQRRKIKLFTLEEYLFPQQLAFVNDTARFKVAVTTRRAGKTVSCAADLVHTAINNLEVDCLYITLARSTAKRIVWPELKRINRQFKLGAIFNESDLTMKLPNGSNVICSGASDKTEIEKFRGQAFKKVYIDEAQSFPSYIEELIDDVISPALMDYAGILCLIGTPGPIPSGYFYDISGNSNWSRHSWSYWDNPFIIKKSGGKSHQEIFEEDLKRRGVGPENASIQREWYGKWVLDSDSLVYHYKEDKNHYDVLPNLKWNYIMGVDLGFNDADAISVLAWTDSAKEAYLIRETITRHQGITELVDQIEQYRKEFDISKIVLDTGGLGKKISEELSRRYRISCLPAEKQRKAEYIELMNDALRTGSLKIRKDSRFAQDAMKVEWDNDKCTPDKKVISKRFHSDICESVLYAWRELYNYTYQKPIEKPKVGSKEWTDALEEAALEHFTKLTEASKDPFEGY